MKNEIKNKIMSRVKKIHFIGIGGSGMSGIALILCDLGYEVSGSDLNVSATIDNLKNKCIKIFIGHKKENILSKDVVVISSAIDKDNPELKYAKQLGIPVIKRAEMLAELMRFSFGVAIAGTHGKTTTTSILSHIMNEAKFDPTYIIGGKIIDSSNAKLGSSEYLLAEADESDASFLHLQPLMSVITNIDKDHLENHKNSFDFLKKNFIAFVNNLPFYGLCLLNISDINTKSIINKISRPIKTFGFDKNSDFYAIPRDLNNIPVIFDYKENDKMHEMQFNMPGEHNVLNCLAAIAVSRELGISVKNIQKSLKSFPGIKRRFEILGNYKTNNKSFIWIDDYGHHPTEIKEVLRTIKRVWEKKNITMVFQPHRYSRVQNLYGDFCRSFNDVDVVLVLPVYAAGEKEGSHTHEDLYKGILDHGHRNVHYASSLQAGLDWVQHYVESGDVVVSLGAGNVNWIVYSLRDWILADELEFNQQYDTKDEMA